MAGRNKIKTYQYNENGKRINMFDSFQEVRNKYYDGSKYPLFANRKDSEMHILPDNTFLFKKPTHRDDVIKKIKRINNEFLITNYLKNKPIEVFNIDNIKIAEFYNESIASKLMNITRGQIASMVRNKHNSAPKNKLGITIKYKD